jgi:hypothetical protein
MNGNTETQISASLPYRTTILVEGFMEYMEYYTYVLVQIRLIMVQYDCKSELTDNFDGSLLYSVST